MFMITFLNAKTNKQSESQNFSYRQSRFADLPLLLADKVTVLDCQCLIVSFLCHPLKFLFDSLWRFRHFILIVFHMQSELVSELTHSYIASNCPSITFFKVY